MEKKWKAIINDMESKYFNDLIEIKSYLKENKWESAKIYELVESNYELAYFL